MKLKHFIFIALISISLFSLFSCSPKTYTVSFDSNGGSAVSAQVIKEGEKVASPEAPTKEGYTFKGWFDGDAEWLFTNGTVEKDTVLKAKWEKNKYEVTFDANGGSGGTVKTVTHGEKITAPLATRPKHSLVGWFVGDKQWDFKTDTVTSDVTLVAKWEAFN